MNKETKMALGACKEDLRSTTKKLERRELENKALHEQIAKLKDELATYESLKDLHEKAAEIKHFPALKAHTVFWAKDERSGTSGFMNVTYTIQGTQVVKVELSPYLNLRESAINRFKIDVGNDVLANLNSRVIPVEMEGHAYKIITKDAQEVS